ncbi:MAG: type II toxin-antitoxin system HicB family antitoxin [bacterium]|nr:type II toxin-antitoxin system HicB family antitoxin [bacterium]
MEFIIEKIKKAKFEVLEDKTYYGYIPGYRGVWANEKTLKTCKIELGSAFEDWILFTLKDGGTVPGLNVGKKVSISFCNREFARYA